MYCVRHPDRVECPGGRQFEWDGSTKSLFIAPFDGMGSVLQSRGNWDNDPGVILGGRKGIYAPGPGFGAIGGMSYFAIALVIALAYYLFK